MLEQLVCLTTALIKFKVYALVLVLTLKMLVNDISYVEREREISTLSY